MRLTNRPYDPIKSAGTASEDCPPDIWRLLKRHGEERRRFFPACIFQSNRSIRNCGFNQGRVVVQEIRFNLPVWISPGVPCSRIQRSWKCSLVTITTGDRVGSLRERLLAIAISNAGLRRFQRGVESDDAEERSFAFATTVRVFNG